MYRADVRLVTKASAKSVWPNEEDFVTWLMDEERLEALSRETGTALYPLGTEMRVSHGRVDLLCGDEGTGGTVVVEARLGQCDVDHVARAARYAAEFSADRAILIAESFPHAVLGAVKGGSRALELLHLVELRIQRESDYEDYRATLSGLAGYVASPGHREGGGGKYGDEVVSAVVGPGGAAGFVAENLGAKAAEFEEEPGWMQKKSTLVVMWPEFSTDWQFVSTMLAAGTEEALGAGGIVLVLKRKVATTARQLASLGHWTEQELLAYVARSGSKGEVKLQPIDWKGRVLGQEAKSVSTKDERMRFWDRVAQRVVKKTGTAARERKKRALGRSSHNIVYPMNKWGVRMAAKYSVRHKALCAEVRFYGSEPAGVRNRYEQLKSHESEIEAGLSDAFEVEWLGSRTRQNAMVMRMVWKRQVGGDSPYRDLELADEFAEAVLEAEGVLLPHAKNMVEFLW